MKLRLIKQLKNGLRAGSVFVAHVWTLTSSAVRRQIVPFIVRLHSTCIVLHVIIVLSELAHKVHWLIA